MTLAEYLARHNISQADFAAQIGATQAAVSRYASGARMPKAAHMASIRSATHGTVTADDFIPREETVA